MVSTRLPTRPAGAPSMTISLVNGVNPLQTTLLELGIVSGRVALLLRSAEIQPSFGRFVQCFEWHFSHSNPPPSIDYKHIDPYHFISLVHELLPGGTKCKRPRAPPRADLLMGLAHDCGAMRYAC